MKAKTFLSYLAAWVSSNGIAYWSKGPEFRSRICRWIFLWKRIILRNILCLCPLFMFCPVLPSKEPCSRSYSESHTEKRMQLGCLTQLLFSPKRLQGRSWIHNAETHKHATREKSHGIQETNLSSSVDNDVVTVASGVATTYMHVNKFVYIREMFLWTQLSRGRKQREISFSRWLIIRKWKSSVSPVNFTSGVHLP